MAGCVAAVVWPGRCCEGAAGIIVECPTRGLGPFLTGGHERAVSRCLNDCVEITGGCAANSDDAASHRAYLALCAWLVLFVLECG